MLIDQADNHLKPRVFIRQQRDIREGKLKYIPAGSELYSRSKGLLEVSVLENCKVGIVGLGSGGSPVALELAKAGVGHLVLIDFDRLELANVVRHVCGSDNEGK